MGGINFPGEYQRGLAGIGCSFDRVRFDNLKISKGF